MDVLVASVMAADRPRDQMSSEEVEETNSTFYIRPQGIPAGILVFFQALILRPAGLGAGLMLAIRSSRWDLIKLAKHLRYLAEALMAGFWMRKVRADHLHTHFASTVALFARTVFPIQISATIHGPGEFVDPYGFLIPEKVRAATFVVAISKYGRSQLMRFSDPRDWSKITVVRLGVNTSEFGPDPGPSGASDRFQIICVGRLAPVKAQHILLAACAILVAKGRPLLLSLVGHGPDREDLEQAAERLQIAKQVVFHGALSNDRVIDLYRSADCFALASFAEGIPVVLMEAMAMAVPCIATAITGIPELILNEREGLLIPPSDEFALAQAIERLMDDPELRRTLAAAGRRKILREYELSRSLEALAQVMSAPLRGADSHPITKEISISGSP